MSNNYKSTSFKEWLTQLQQESWQLELIISGFAIFGLFTAFDPIVNGFVIAQSENQVYPVLLYGIAIAACSILIFNLILHVILRGLWIGALGLRYISGDIEYEKLKYSLKFTKYLEKKVGSFDKYIATLEDYCSILFAVSFLLIFYVLSAVAVLLTILLIVFTLLETDFIPYEIGEITGIFLIIFIIIATFLNAIDFITQGYLKRNKWLSKIYFPFYWVYGYITLSFIYRPLVYNFLDNTFGKRLLYALIPIYGVLLILITFKYEKSNYLQENLLISSQSFKHEHYEDLLSLEQRIFAKTATIQSKVITDPYIKLFRIHNNNLESRIFNWDSTLIPKNDERGLKSELNFFSSSKISDSKKRRLSKTYLKAFNNTHKIVIDSIEYPHDFLFSKNKQGNIGFETYLNIKGLSDGKHLLRLKSLFIKEKDTLIRTDDIIPFWYFKNN